MSGHQFVSYMRTRPFDDYYYRERRTKGKRVLCHDQDIYPTAPPMWYYSAEGLVDSIMRDAAPNYSRLEQYVLPLNQAAIFHG